MNNLIYFLTKSQQIWYKDEQWNNALI